MAEPELEGPGAFIKEAGSQEHLPRLALKPAFIKEAGGQELLLTLALKPAVIKELVGQEPLQTLDLEQRTSWGSLQRQLKQIILQQDNNQNQQEKNPST